MRKVKEDLLFGSKTISADVVNCLRLTASTLSNKYTRQVFEFLARNPNTNVTTIYRRLKIEQSVASASLRQLKNCKFVECEKAGKNRLYSISGKTQRIVSLLGDLKNIIK